MSETGISRVARRAGMTNEADPQFTDIGFAVFDEDFIDFVYKVYLDMSASNWAYEKKDGYQSSSGAGDVASIYKNGIYIPLTERVVFTGQVDVMNFDLPQFASLLLSRPSGNNFIFVSKVDKLPREFVAATRGTNYKLAILSRRFPDDKDLSLNTLMFTVKPDGQASPCLNKMLSKDSDVARCALYFMHAGVTAINSADDARTLWQVKTSEDIAGIGLKTPLVFGSDPERVKSLFYARSLPMTATGRKSPILHWVTAHKRRVQSGIDVDISKHLRGTERFEMGGFEFEITNPTKPTPKGFR